MRLKREVSLSGLWKHNTRRRLGWSTAVNASNFFPLGINRDLIFLPLIFHFSTPHIELPDKIQHSEFKFVLWINNTWKILILYVYIYKIGRKSCD